MGTPLPAGWTEHVRAVVVSAASLAQAAATYTRSWCADSPLRCARLAGRLDKAENEIALLREELRIKDARMGRIPPRHRPFYPPAERMAVLELKAARGWNLALASKTFLVEPETVATWMRRIEDDSLVRTPEPLNKFPDFVRHIVRRLKVLCPAMGNHPDHSGQPHKST